MKKITFKILLMLLVCMMGLQTFAQKPDTPYRLRTFLASSTDFNAQDPPYEGQFIYPTLKSGNNALDIIPREDLANNLQFYLNLK